MNLTQRQLAALAKVSTPTISRFEQNDKDIQLSSALAILDALGMTDKRTLVFPTRNTSYDISDGRHLLGSGRDERASVCRISREALDDHFSEGDARPEAAFKKYRAAIEALARRKYLLGELESENSVVITTQDVT